MPVVRKKVGEERAAPVLLTPIKIEDAAREVRQLLIGLCSPSGQGKTVSALRLATGLAKGGTVVLVDTENGRALTNAPRQGEEPRSPYTFAFKHTVLKPPFTPARYRAVAKAAAKLQPAVIIFDSMYHEWMGLGGMLDMVDDAGGTFRDWKGPKKAHTAFMNLVTSLPCHIIFCARAKEKFEQVKAGGKWEVVSTGWHPVCETGLPYDMTINLLLEKGVPVDDSEFDEWKIPGVMEEAGSIIPRDRPLDEATGIELADWCSPQKSWADFEQTVESKTDEPDEHERPIEQTD